MKSTMLVCLVALVSGTVGAASASSVPAAVAGETLFRQRCQACHSVTVNQAPGLGPNLAGVIGRKAGSTAFAYSPAMKGARLVWTRANIDRFLANPQAIVPGARMAISVPKPQDRKAIIDFLARTR